MYGGGGMLNFQQNHLAGVCFFFYKPFVREDNIFEQKINYEWSLTYLFVN